MKGELERKGLRLALALLAALVTLLLVRVGASQVPNDDERLQEKLRAVIEAESKPDALDPETAAEIREKYLSGIALADENYRKWLADFNSRSVELRTLEWVEILAGFPGPKSIDEAVKKADLIVIGSAVAVRFLPTTPAIGRTLVTVRVDHVLKRSGSDSSQELVVAFGGGPAPYPGDPSRAVIGYVAAAPLLLPGDIAILFLQQSPGGAGWYEPQILTGVNKIQDGMAVTIEDSPLQPLIDHKPLAEAVQAIATAIASATDPP
ncbi:MAG TPA: hypothetical protein VNN21_00905 [Dehalococcoidia bacterium]|nr:hypothetical protein [Dehalococcoidia bacterium]